MLMKKILVVHTKYQELGGEDIAVEKEIQLLEKYFDVETLFFDNKIDNYFKQLTSFLINDNKESKRKLEEKIKLLRITKSVSTQDEARNKESRQKINEYVREIDKCIALLNK